MLVTFVAACGEAAAPPPPPEPPEPPIAEVVAPPPPEVPADDPAHPTMGARRADATEIVGTESPAARIAGATLVPQIVHRTPPTVALADGDRVLVWGERRVAIVERGSGAVRDWRSHPAESARPTMVDFGTDGRLLVRQAGGYEDFAEDRLTFYDASGAATEIPAPRNAPAALVRDGVALADGALHIHPASDPVSAQTVELDWSTTATRMVVSGDGRLVALESETGELRIVHVERGAVVARVHAEPWAPLGALRAHELAERTRRAAESEVRRDDEGYEDDDDDDEAANEPEPSEHRAWAALVFSADARRFAAVRSDGLARVLDLTTSGALASIEPGEGAHPGDIARAVLDDDGGLLVLEPASGPRAYFNADTGEPVAAPAPTPGDLDAALSSREPFDPAPFLAAPLGGEHSVWRAPPIAGMDAFLIAGRGAVTVVGPGVVRAIHCIDGEAPIRFEGWPGLAIQDRGTCDLRTDEGPAFDPGTRFGEDDIDDDGEYLEAEEEPEVTVVRGLLAVLGEGGHRTPIPGTEGISLHHVRIVDVSDGPLLIADDGTSARVFRTRPPGLLATVAPEEAPYRTTSDALYVTGPTHWRALAVDGARELASLPLDEAHSGATPAVCRSPDGSRIAVGIGATLHVLDASWQPVATLSMPAADGACVHGDQVLVQRSRGVVEVWSIEGATRTAVWSVSEQDSIVSVRLGIALVQRRITTASEAAQVFVLDVVDLRQGRVLRTFDASGIDSTEERTLSDDGRFVSWPDDVTARIVRLADGASIRLGVVSSGRAVHAYAVAESGAFSTQERSVGVFRVREAGPAGTAALLDAAVTRARFYRPTLLDDFLHDRSLPTPGDGATPE